MKTMMLRTLAAVIALVLLALAFYLSESAFRQVLDFRQLERIPLSQIARSVGGESQLQGRAVEKDALVRAPKTGTQAIYYRYLMEREEKDSDGNTSWRTVRDESEARDFSLVDDSGQAWVKARRSATQIKWSVAEKYRREEGRYRHTEWRIDPGDRVTLYGWLTFRDSPVVDFSTDGQYLPIISSFSASEERASIAFDAILRLWGGVTLLTLACFAVVYTLRIHRTLVFLTIVSTTSCLLLFHYGYRSVEADVDDGYARAELQWQRASKLVKDAFRGSGLLAVGLESNFDLNSLAYAQMPEAARDQVNAWRLSAWQVRERYLQQVDRFPESYVAKAKGKHLPPEVRLPADQLAVAEAQQSNFQETRLTTSLLWLILLVVATAGLAWLSLVAIKTKRTQENIPTSKTAGVVYGLAEVKGKLVAEEDSELLEGPLSNQFCCWYRYKVEEKRQSGKKSSWVTIEDVTKKQPFYCEDEEGRIRVFPGNAECITTHIERDRHGRRRYTEWRLSPGDDLYVLGKARLDKTRGDSLVFGHEKGMPFIIANIPEEEVMLRKAMTGMGFLSVAISLVFLGALILAGTGGQFSSLDFLLASLAAPLFLIFVVFVLMYNDLIFLRQRCERNWANIQVSLKKRADLVPQLERVVRKYLAHEAGLQEALVQLRERRQAVTSARDIDEYMALEHDSIGQVSARVEQYPDLEGIDLVADFNRRLIKLENEVALIRAGFNDAVTQYRTRCETFPDNLLASLFGFRLMQLLRYEEKAHRIAPVSFAPDPT